MDPVIHLRSINWELIEEQLDTILRLIDDLEDSLQELEEAAGLSARRRRKRA